MILQNIKAIRLRNLCLLMIIGISLSACSGESFHLRGSVALPDEYQRIYLQGEPSDRAFGKVLEKALEAVGSERVDDAERATAILQLNNYQEGKRVAGYGKDREVREYLIYLRFNFSTRSTVNSQTLLTASKVNLDKLQIYDSAFVLGKIEEERLIKEDLRKNAVRQIILRLQYASKKQHK